MDGRQHFDTNSVRDSVDLMFMEGLKSKDRSEMIKQVDNKMSMIAMDGRYSKDTGVQRQAS